MQNSWGVADESRPHQIQARCFPFSSLICYQCHNKKQIQVQTYSYSESDTLWKVLRRCLVSLKAAHGKHLAKDKWCYSVFQASSWLQSKRVCIALFASPSITAYLTAFHWQKAFNITELRSIHRISNIWPDNGISGNSPQKHKYCMSNTTVNFY